MCRIQSRLFEKLDASCSEEMAYFHRETIDFYFEECGGGSHFFFSFSHWTMWESRSDTQLIDELPNVRLIVYGNRRHCCTSESGRS